MIAAVEVAAMAAREPNVDVALMRMAFRQMRISLSMTAGAVLIFVGLFWPYFPPEYSKLWVFALVGATAVRGSLALAFYRASPGVDSISRWRLLFVAGATVGGLSWSAGPTFMIPGLEGSELAVLVGALLSASAVAMISLVAHEPAMHAFVATALIPPAVAILGRAQVVEALSAPVMLAGMISLMYVGRRSSRGLRAQLEAEYALAAAAAAADAARDRYFELFEQAPVGYCNVDPDGCVVEANLTASKLLRVDTGALIGSSLATFIVDEDRGTYELHRHELIGTGTTEPFDVRMVGPGGKTFWAQLTATGVRDARCAPVFRIALSDSTERRRAEDARAAAVIDASMDAIIGVDENERVVVFSAAAERMFQIPAARAVGQTLDSFIPHRHRLTHHQHVLDFRKADVPVRAMSPHAAISALRGDGTEFPVEASISHISSGGKDLATVTLRDITERVKAAAAQASLEDQLRQSQKMEAIGTLAGGIAHDFNNILTIISGNLELLESDLRSEPPDRRSVDEIQKAADRARDLVRQILSFGRRQQSEHRALALGVEVRDASRLLRSIVPARIDLDVACAAAVPDVMADRTQIQQVLINLVTNAMQAIGEAVGRIGIRLDVVQMNGEWIEKHPAVRELYNRRPGRAVRLAVSDNGPGMSPATVSRVFEPFFTTKSVDQGTGLGLSVVHGIALSHGGAIEVDSEVGRGATFTLYLPSGPAIRAAGTQPRERRSTPVPRTKRARRILYVDDDPALVTTVTRALHRRGIIVAGFTDVRQALDALRDDVAGFDLVVTDYNMPVLSGLDVARAVRAIRADLPVAMASGFVDERLTAEAAGAGVQEVIFKADDAEGLCDAFERLVSAES